MKSVDTIILLILLGLVSCNTATIKLGEINDLPKLPGDLNTTPEPVPAPGPTSWIDALNELVPFKAGTKRSGYVRHGDINGDGIQDIVLIDSVNNEIEVLFNAGGSFTRNVASLFVDSDTMDCNVGDLNGDGFGDIACTHYSNARVETYLGDGAGGFVSQGHFSTFSNPYRLEIADFNSDGLDDMAIIFYTGSNMGLAIYLRSGGSFTMAHQKIIASYPRRVYVKDLDGNGRPDVVFSGDFTQKAYVVYSRLNGTFYERELGSEVSGAGVYGVAGSDFDGDGDTDIVLTYRGTSQIGLFKNNAPVESFSKIGELTPGIGSLTDVWALDYNSDGKGDFILYSSSKSRLQVYLGNGNFTFQAPFDLNGVPLYHRIDGFSDFNGDGFIDMYLSPNNSGQNSITILENNQSNGFVPFGDSGARQTVDLDGSGTSSGAFRFVDLNNDQKSDLVSAAIDGGLEVRLNTGTGFETLASSTMSLSGVYGHEFADLNNDTFLDMVMPDYLGQKIKVFLNDGTGHFGASIDTAVPIRPYKLAIVNINGDAFPDLVYHGSNETSVRTRLSNGTGGFTTEVVTTTTHRPFEIVALNLDGNDRRDVAVYSFDSGYAYVGFETFRNNGDGTLSSLGTYHDSNFTTFKVEKNDNNFDDLNVLGSDGRLFLYKNDGVTGAFDSGTEKLSLYLNFLDYQKFKVAGKDYYLFHSQNMRGSALYEKDKSGFYVFRSYPNLGCVGGLGLIDLNGDTKEDLVATDTCAGHVNNFVQVLTP